MLNNLSKKIPFSRRNWKITSVVPRLFCDFIIIFSDENNTAINIQEMTDRITELEVSMHVHLRRVPFVWKNR